MQIFYLPELLVFDNQVTNISINLLTINQHQNKRDFNNFPSDMKIVKINNYILKKADKQWKMFTNTKVKQQCLMAILFNYLINFC